MRSTIPLRWSKPYSNQWIANTSLAIISINKVASGYTIQFDHMEADGMNEFRRRSIRHPKHYDTLVAAKERLQNEFDEMFVPLAKKLRAKPRKTKPRKPPMCY